MLLVGQTPGDRARLDAGPTEADGVCTLRGRDGPLIIAGELGVMCSFTQAYEFLHKLGNSCLAPHPRREHHDPGAAGISPLRG